MPTLNHSEPGTSGPTVSLTQKQIAERLGVSQQLVSFALRGGGRMSDEVRGQILDMAQHTGYGKYSNREARALASRRHGKRAASGILAVIYQTTFENEPTTNLPYFTTFFKGLEGEAVARGFEIALCALRPHELPRLVRDGQADGVIGLLTPGEISRDASRLGLPVVNVLCAAPGGINLVIDDAAGSALATRHLVQLGHRHIAYIGVDVALAMGKERLHGYESALREHAIARESKLVEIARELPSAGTGAETLQKLLAKNASGGKPAGQNTPGFTALVCYNDAMAMGAVRALHENGYRVPDDVSVVGFDDVSLEYSFHPALTSIGFSREKMGRRAIEVLSEWETREEGNERREIFPLELVERDSTRHL